MPKEQILEPTNQPKINSKELKLNHINEFFSKHNQQQKIEDNQKELVEALKLFRYAFDLKLNPDRISDAITRFRIKRSIEFIKEKKFDEAKKIINEHYEYEGQFYKIFAEELLKTNNKEVFEDVLLNIEFKESFRKKNIYEEINKKLKEEEYVDNSICDVLKNIYKKLKEKDGEVRPPENIILVLIRNGKISQALEEFEEIIPEYKNYAFQEFIAKFLLRQIAEYYIEEKDFENFYKILNEIHKRNELIMIDNPLVAIVHKLLAYEYYEEAKKIIDEFKIDQEVSLEMIRSRLYERYAKNLIDDVDEKVEKIKSNLDKMNIKIGKSYEIDDKIPPYYSALRTGGDLTKLYQLYENEKIEWNKIYYLEKILEKEIKEKNFEDYKELLEEYTKYLQQNERSHIQQCLVDKVFEKIKKIGEENFLKELEGIRTRPADLLSYFLFPYYILSFSKWEESEKLKKYHIEKAEYNMHRIKLRLFFSKNEKKEIIRQMIEEYLKFRLIEEQVFISARPALMDTSVVRFFLTRLLYVEDEYINQKILKILKDEKMNNSIRIGKVYILEYFLAQGKKRARDELLKIYFIKRVGYSKSQKEEIKRIKRHILEILRKYSAIEEEVEKLFLSKEKEKYEEIGRYLYNRNIKIESSILKKIGSNIKVTEISGKFKDLEKKQKIISKVKNKDQLIELIKDEEYRLALFISRKKTDYDEKMNFENFEKIIREILKYKTSEEVFEEFSNLLNHEKKERILKSLLEGSWPFSGSSKFNLLDFQDTSSFEQNTKLKKAAIDIIKLYILINKIKEEEIVKIQNLEILKQKVEEFGKDLEDKEIKQFIEKKFFQSEHKKFFIELFEENEGFLFPLDIKKKALETKNYFYSCLKTQNRITNKVFKNLIQLWQENLYNNYQNAEKEIQYSQVSKYKNLSLRYLDKVKDFYECIRIADSVDCCFNSNNIWTYNKNYKNISKLWADPLSFMFQIEYRIDNKKVKPLGFLFGSFGIVKNKTTKKQELAVLLNKVYLNFDSPYIQKKSLEIIEENFSKKIGAKWQIVGGIDIDLYLNQNYLHNDLKIKRLIALENSRKKPIKKIYDDLGEKANLYYKNKFLKIKKLD